MSNQENQEQAVSVRGQIADLIAIRDKQDQPAVIKALQAEIDHLVATYAALTERAAMIRQDGSWVTDEQAERVKVINATIPDLLIERDQILFGGQVTDGQKYTWTRQGQAYSSVAPMRQSGGSKDRAALIAFRQFVADNVRAYASNIAKRDTFRGRASRVKGQASDVHTRTADLHSAIAREADLAIKGQGLTMEQAVALTAIKVINGSADGISQWIALNGINREQAVAFGLTVTGKQADKDQADQPDADQEDQEQDQEDQEQADNG